MGKILFCAIKALFLNTKTPIALILAVIVFTALTEPATQNCNQESESNLFSTLSLPLICAKTGNSDKKKNIELSSSFTKINMITPQFPTSFPMVSRITTPTPIHNRNISNSDYNSLIDSIGNEFQIDTNLLKRIAQCESGFNPKAVNGPYGGMFQFHYQTWATTRTKMGLDTNPDLRFNAEESIKTAAYKISLDGTSAWPNCSR